MSSPGSAAFLDTSRLARYQINDTAEMADLAAAVIDSDEPSVVSELVLVETAYLLESFYLLPRTAIVNTLIAFVQRPNVRTLRLPKALVLEGLRLRRGSKRISFTDALLWAEARGNGSERIYSFDRRLLSDGFEVVGSGLST